MQLHSLRPKAGFDLEQFYAMSEGRGWHATLPSTISDVHLLQLARAFRSVERSYCAKDENDTSSAEQSAMELAIYAVMNLLADHPARGLAQTELTISEKGMVQALQVYQLSLEREIISRIVGEELQDPTAWLMDGLWKCIQE